MQNNARISYIRSSPMSGNSAWPVINSAVRSQPPPSLSTVDRDGFNNEAHYDKEDTNRTTNGTWKDMINEATEYSKGQAN